MSVRLGLLAILDQGDCYGYQLRAEYARRAGAAAPLNAGQIYNTLDRLRRDGLVVEGDTDEHGHVYWRITDAGTAAVRAWLDQPVTRSSATRDELVAKISLAATLPGIDIDEVLRGQRAASEAQLELVRGQRADAREFSHSLALDAMVLASEAEVRWLDSVAERLARHPSDTVALELSADKPKRGRPARAAASGP